MERSVPKMNCQWCKKSMLPPRRGPIATTCSDACRQALSRHNRKMKASPPLLSTKEVKWKSREKKG